MTAMMLSRLRLIKRMNKNQKGFTLLEMTLAILIGAIIAGGITATIFQVVMGSGRTNNHMIAVRQVQSAGYWVSHDAQMAQSVVAARDADGFPLTLSWTDWDGTLITVTYTIEGGELKRKLDRKPAVGSETSETTTVARFIDVDLAKTKCQLAGGGTFTLPDSGDTFTISGGAVADSGKITLATGSISVTSAGGATYSPSTGAWTTPAAGGTVTVSRAGVTDAVGVWTSAMASAMVAITANTDGDATITGGTLIFTLTATVGPSSQTQTETRVYKIVPRPGS